MTVTADASCFRDDQQALSFIIIIISLIFEFVSIISLISRKIGEKKRLLQGYRG